MLLIAQISDLHVGFGGDAADERNAVRCSATIDHLLTMKPLPDMVIASGDLTERGDDASYMRLRAMLARLPMPVHLMTGNHDVRAALLRCFPDTPIDDGFVQAVVEVDGRRIILLDTVEEGRAGGGFCARRAAWLAARLDEAPDVPTLIVVHHPPFASGTDWMDATVDARWISRLHSAISAGPQVVALLAGHLHREVVGMFAKRPCIVASSVAPQIALDLRSTDVAIADGRALIVEGPPAFMLHRWTDDGLASHVVRVEAPPVLARFEQPTRGWVDALRLETSSG